MSRKEKNDPTVEYMHVEKSEPLHEVEEDKNADTFEAKINAIFYRRLNFAIRFSRNLLEHLKDKTPLIKEKYLALIENKEELESILEEGEEEAIKSFSFFHPALIRFYQSSGKFTIVTIRIKDSQRILLKD